MPWLRGPGLFVHGSLAPRPAPHSAFCIPGVRARAKRRNASLHRESLIGQGPRGNLQFPEIRSFSAVRQIHLTLESIGYAHLWWGWNIVRPCLGSLGQHLRQRLFQTKIRPAEKLWKLTKARMQCLGPV